MCLTWFWAVIGDATSTEIGTTAPFSAIRGTSSFTMPAPALIGRAPKRRFSPSCTVSCWPSCWACARRGARRPRAPAAATAPTAPRSCRRVTIGSQYTVWSWSPGRRWEEDVPPHAERADDDDHEEDDLELGRVEPAADGGAQLRAGDRAHDDRQRRQPRQLPGHELADEPGGRGQGGDRQRAADGHADRHTNDDQQQRHEQKRA